MEYLTNIPAEASEYGLDKVLAVRRESIHLKHIFTEVFERKTIPLESMLRKANINLFDYMAVMTSRFRKIYHFNREYECDNFKDLTTDHSAELFEQIAIYKGLQNVLVVSYEVINEYNFQNMFYNRLAGDLKVIVLSNKSLPEDWFNKRHMAPAQVIQLNGHGKIKQLIQLTNKFDNLFYLDIDTKELDYAWIYGWKTYKFVPEKKKEKKIHHYTLKTNTK